MDLASHVGAWLPRSGLTPTTDSANTYERCAQDSTTHVLDDQTKAAINAIYDVRCCGKTVLDQRDGRVRLLDVSGNGISAKELAEPINLEEWDDQFEAWNLKNVRVWNVDKDSSECVPWT